MRRPSHEAPVWPSRRALAGSARCEGHVSHHHRCRVPSVRARIDAVIIDRRSLLKSARLDFGFMALFNNA